MTPLTPELLYNNRKWCAAWLVSVLFIVKLVLLQRAEVDVVKSLMRKCLDGKVYQSTETYPSTCYIIELRAILGLYEPTMTS